MKAIRQNVCLDMFSSDDNTCLYMCDRRGNNFVDVEFSPADARYDFHSGGHIITPDRKKLTYYDGDDDCKEPVQAAKSSEAECLVISRRPGGEIHYAV